MPASRASSLRTMGLPVRPRARRSCPPTSMDWIPRRSLVSSTSSAAELGTAINAVPSLIVFRIAAHHPQPEKPLRDRSVRLSEQHPSFLHHSLAKNNDYTLANILYNNV